MADASLLEVANIETCYGLSQVLFGMSLAIAPGEMVTLMGRNGMGKTTTVRSIMGLTAAMAGSIRVGGREIRWLRPQPTAAAPPSRGRSVGFARCSRDWRSASPTWPTSSPAASSRCWRSGAP
jgi:ABC-type branched-subunit amino acid transport system ATPase component